MNVLSQDKPVKVALIICFLLVCASILVARGAPANGYETSIYASTPWIFWAMIFACIACGTGIVVYRASAQKLDWLFGAGFALIVLCDIIIISLHVLRGYYLWNIQGDSGSHLGWALDIINSGVVGQQIYYPVTHVMLASISMVANIDPLTLFRWMPAAYVPVYMVFIYFFARRVLPRREHAALAAVVGTLLLSGWFNCFAPIHFGNQVFPLAMYLMLRSKSGGAAWNIVFIVIVMLLAAIHPLTSFTMLVVMGCMLAYSIVRSLKDKNEWATDVKPDIIMLALMLVVSITWISSYGIWGGYLMNSYRAMLGVGASSMDQMLNTASYASEHEFNILTYFINMYGGMVIVIALAMAAVLFIYRSRVRATYLRVKYIIPPIFAILAMISALYFFAPYFSPTRLLQYVIALCTLPAGVVLYQAVAAGKERGRALWALSCIAVMAVLIIGSILAVVALYPSPYTYSASLQTTESELAGISHLFTNKSPGIIRYTSWFFSPNVYADYMVPVDERYTKVEYTPYTTSQFPNHFGYDNGTLLGSYYTTGTYLVIRDAVKHTYTELYPGMAKYRLLPEDFDTLEADASVNKLYSNGGLDLWYIRSLT